MRKFASEQGIKMYKEGDGIEHTVVTEEGFVRPGEVVVATDSHTDTVGAIGALGFGIGTTEAEYALALGEIYDFNVPETYKFNISGEFSPGSSAEGSDSDYLGHHEGGRLLQARRRVFRGNHAAHGDGWTIYYVQHVSRDERENWNRKSRRSHNGFYARHHYTTSRTFCRINIDDAEHGEGGKE